MEKNIIIERKLVSLIKDNNIIQLESFIKENICGIEFNELLYKTAIINNSKESLKVLIKYTNEISNLFEYNFITPDFLKNLFVDDSIKVIPDIATIFIKNNRLELLKVIFEDYLFNNTFILKLLLHYGLFFF